MYVRTSLCVLMCKCGVVLVGWTASGGVRGNRKRIIAHVESTVVVVVNDIRNANDFRNN